jgi:predicted carbohydrate-binding protein with CBM5 and CBM33 domain
MRLIRRTLGSAAALAVLAPIAVGAAPAAWSHGYVGGGSSDLVARAALRTNAGLGAVQYEPQSIEGTKGFPEAGPADGQLASAGNARFAELDQQSADRWVKNAINPGPNAVSWVYTAAHKTTKWDYFMTKPGWDQNAPLTRASLEKIGTVAHDGSMSTQNVVHTVDVPADRAGYHVIYAVWTVDDTNNAFYNVIDVDVSGQAAEVVPPPAEEEVAPAPVEPPTVAPEQEAADTGAIPLTATVPRADEATGSLVMSIAGTGAGLALGEGTNVGDRLRFGGALPTVSVTDSRSDEQADGGGWTVSGRAVDLTAGSQRLTADHLGWTPVQLTDKHCVTPGSPTSTSLSGGTGLAGSATLATASSSGRTGTADLSADLVLEVPVDAPAGSYTGSLTLTLFPVD